MSTFGTPNSQIKSQFIDLFTLLSSQWDYACGNWHLSSHLLLYISKQQVNIDIAAYFHSLLPPNAIVNECAANYTAV